MATARKNKYPTQPLLLYRFDSTRAPIPPVYDPVEDENPMEEAHRMKKIAKACAWMTGLTCLFCFIPTVNGLIGGIVGGHMVGNSKKAVLLAIFPAQFLLCYLWILLTSLLDFFPMFRGPQLGVAIVLSLIGLFLGAAIGGTIAEAQVDDENRA